MDSLTIVGYFAIVFAGAYLITALLLYPRLRRAQRAAAASPHSQAILNLADRAPHSDEPTPERMRKLAGLCATIGSRVFGEKFDFSLESVAAVDRAVMRGWGESEPAADDDVVLSFGAYLGEVLVRHTRGRWVTGLVEGEPGEVLFLAPSDDEAVNFSPFRLVREKFENPYRFDLSIAMTALQQKLKELQAA